MIELCAFHTSVKVTLLDYLHDDTEGDDSEVTRAASDASHTSSAFVANLGSAANINHAALHPPLPADISLTSNAAQLQSHVSSIAAILTQPGAPQPTAAVVESQQASSPENVNPQVKAPPGLWMFPALKHCRLHFQKHAEHLLITKSPGYMLI